MRRLAVAGLGVVLLGGCGGKSAGRSPRPLPEAKIGAERRPDSTARFFDSLSAALDTAARRDERVRLDPMPDPVAAGVRWLGVFRDTSLIALVEAALARSRDLAEARARVAEFRENARAALAPLFPTLSANASAGANRVAIGANRPVEYEAFRVTADVGWELDFWGRHRRGADAARFDLEAEEANQKAVALSLISGVATLYLQLLELDQERAIAERTLSARRKTLALAVRRFEQGQTSELDVRQFEAQVAVLATALVRLERAQAQTEHALNALLGDTPRPVARTTSLQAVATGLIVPDTLTSTLLSRRPDVQQSERAYAAAMARVGIVNAARLPTVTLTGSYGRQGPTPNRVVGSGSDIYQLQAGMSAPVFNRGRFSAAKQAALARADQAQARYERVMLQAMREVGDALAQVRTGRDEAAAQETQVAALRRALELAELRYTSGVASYLEVLEAQRSLFTAELAASQAQLLQLLAAVQLYKALGGEWGESATPR